MSKEVNLKFHESAATWFIENQASTIENSILELIQNAVTPTTRANQIELTLTNSRFEIKDNGIGFDVETFSILALPKEREEGELGKHFTGRTKILVHGKTAYLTNHENKQHLVLCDFKNNGAKFIVEETNDQLFKKGTKVVCNFYEQLDDSRLEEIKLFIEESLIAIKLLFPSKTIIFNGVRIKKPKNAIELNSCFLIPNGLSATRIFNKGFFVNIFRYWSNNYDIVSKNELNVTNERTNIKEGCLEFEKIKKEVFDYIFKNAKKKSEQMKDCFDIFLECPELVKIRPELPIFKAVNDQRFSFTEVKLTGCFLFINIPFYADKIIESGIPVMEYTFKLEKALKSVGVKVRDEIEAQRKAEKENWSDYDILDPTEVGKKYKRVYLKNFAIALIMNEVVFHSLRELRLGNLGDSVVANTNGDSYINLNAKFLDDRNPLSMAVKLFATLCHEYAHDDSNERIHDHDSLFHEEYRRLVDYKNKAFADFIVGLSKNAYSYEIKEYYSEWELPTQKDKYGRKKF